MSYLGKERRRGIIVSLGRPARKRQGKKKKRKERRPARHREKRGLWLRRKGKFQGEKKGTGFPLLPCVGEKKNGGKKRKEDPWRIRGGKKSAACRSNNQRQRGGRKKREERGDILPQKERGRKEEGRF